MEEVDNCERLCNCANSQFGGTHRQGEVWEGDVNIL